MAKELTTGYVPDHDAREPPDAAHPAEGRAGSCCGASRASACTRAARARTTSATSLRIPPPALIPHELIDVHALVPGAGADHHQRPRVLRSAAQVQHRLRRRRPHRHGRGHERHRREGGEGRRGSLFPHRARRRHGAQGVRPRPRGARSSRPKSTKSSSRSCASTSANGNRADRKKARLKHLLETWTLEQYLAETEKLLGCRTARAPRGIRAAIIYPYAELPHTPHRRLSAKAEGTQLRRGDVAGRPNHAEANACASRKSRTSMAPAKSG